MDETHVNTAATINPLRPILLGPAQAKLELEKLRRSLPASDVFEFNADVACKPLLKPSKVCEGLMLEERRDLTQQSTRARLIKRMDRRTAASRLPHQEPYPRCRRGPPFMIPPLSRH